MNSSARLIHFGGYKLQPPPGWPLQPTTWALQTLYSPVGKDMTPCATRGRDDLANGQPVLTTTHSLSSSPHTPRPHHHTRPVLITTSCPHHHTRPHTPRPHHITRPSSSHHTSCPHHHPRHTELPSPCDPNQSDRLPYAMHIIGVQSCHHLNLAQCRKSIILRAVHTQAWVQVRVRAR